MNTQVFDAYGTLFDVHSAVMRHADAIGPEAARLAEVWRTKQLEYTWVLSGIGAYQSFEALTERALDTAIASVPGVPAGLRARLLDAYRELDAYPEVPAALAQCKDAGETTVVFSNANRSMLERALSASGLSGLVDAVVSVDEVRVFKPHPSTYGLLDPWRGPGTSMTFHSANRWDVAGARARGIKAVWINRRRSPDEYLEFAPTAVATNLAEAVRLARPPAPGGA